MGGKNKIEETKLHSNVEMGEVVIDENEVVDEDKVVNYEKKAKDVKVDKSSDKTTVVNTNETEDKEKVNTNQIETSIEEEDEVKQNIFNRSPIKEDINTKKAVENN